MTEQAATQQDMKRLRHMLGATEMYSRSKWGFRNYFASSFGGETEESMRRLVKAGYATEGSHSNNMIYFHATKEGCIAAGLHKAAIKRAFED